MSAADPRPDTGPDDDRLKIGDAERSAAAAALSRHWAAGRLTAEEFEQRTAAVWSARTGSALTELFQDLPAEGAAAAMSAFPPSRRPAAMLARVATRATTVSRRRLAAGVTVATLAVAGAGGSLAAAEPEQGPCRTVQAAQQDGADECVTADDR